MEDVLIGSTLSALSTGLGAIPILFLKSVTHRWRDILLAFTAGIMVAASTFSLIPEALLLGNLTTLTVGMFLGVFMLTTMEKFIPHIDVEQQAGKQIVIDRKAVLIIAAITLHNIPEGLSVGVSYASDSHDIGNLIAFAIGLQNAPEGFIVALFLVNQNIGRFKALSIATLTGAVEIITAWIGFSLTSYVENLVPYGLSFAAGAMLFIVYKELIPESHGDGNERAATFSFITGLVVMIYLVQLF
jgi:zinc transporter, ZIP family